MDNIPLMKKTLLLRRMAGALCFSVAVSTFGLHAANGVLNVTLKGNNRVAKEYLAEIENQTDYLFVYDAGVNINKKLSINLEDKPVKEALDILSSELGLNYSQKGTYIVLSQSKESQATRQAKKKISGTVVDEAGEPIIGANVKEKGTQNGVITDIDGRFDISVPLNATLTFSYIGYTSKDVVVKDETPLKITLDQDTKSLDEVVVVGYGVQKKSDITGSVASIKTETFKDFNLDVTNVIQGRVAGVNVSNGNIIIRGAASINGSDPLWIVDGVPGDAPNFNDVESIEILKDAASTAIYGAKGAGGVILVTTKRGKAGKMTVNAKVNMGVETGIDIPELLDTPHFIDRKLAAGFPNDPSSGWDNPSSLPNTNWKDILWRNAFQQNYFLQLTGGSENITYNTSAEFYKNQGISIDSGEEGGSLRISSEAKLNKRVKVTEIVNVGYKSENPHRGGVNYRAVPTMEPYDASNPDGGWGMQPAGGYFNGPNPLVEELVYHNNNKTYWANANAILDWELIDNLHFQANFSGKLKATTANEFREAWRVGSESMPDQYTKDFQTGHDLRMFYTLTYDRNFGKHYVKGLVGYEAAQSEYLGAGGWKQGFSIQPAEDMSLGTIVGDVSGGKLQARSISQFARLNYAYDSKYILEASLRRDGYDNFGKNNRYGIFPSASAAWNIARESFIADNYPWISQLKLRGSYGKIGNNTVPQFLYETAFINGGLYYSYDDKTVGRGFWYKGIANPDIKWEDVAQWDLGIDAGFFDNRLNITAEYYQKKTSGMLYDISSPLSTGVSNTGYTANIGEISNKGFELMVQYRNHVNDFHYDVAVTMSTNKNLVERLSDKINPLIWRGWGRGLNASPYLTQNGHPMGEMWGYIVDGIFQDQAEIDALNAKSPTGIYQSAGTAPGDLKYRDLDGDGRIDSNLDKTVIGTPWPKLIYGLNINLSWKNFVLSMGWVGNTRNDVFNAAKTAERSFYGDNNSTYKIYEAWSTDNRDATNPRVTKDDPNGNFKNISSYFVDNGSFLKLKTLHFGYNLPQSFLQKFNVQAMKLFVNCNNILILSKFQGDPELGGGYLERNFYSDGRYPTTKSVMGGISLTF